MKAGKKIKKPLQTTLGRASDQDKLDLAAVRKPIHTSISDLCQVFSALQNATEEVKNYLINECDIIYECRMCRSLFRSLANFILHKRSYCQDKFSSLSPNHAESDQTNDIVQLAEEEINSKKSTPEKNETPTKNTRHDLTLVIEKLRDRADVKQLTQDILNEDLSKTQDDKEGTRVEQNTDTTILLEKIASNNAAAFQTVIGDVAKEFLKPEYMKSEVMEIHNILDNDEAILGPDGKICNFKLNFNKSTQKNDLICTECNLKFSTLKTLTHHVKYKHNDTRLVYICPDCKDTFANPWCVYRHLLRIHRRTTAQIRRMREQIHNSVIKMKDYEPYKKKTARKDGDSSNIDKTDEENQWLNNIEGDKDFQMCGGCGKRFERKAALHSHAQMCTKRIAVCNTIKENSAKKKEEECKDQNKGNKLDKTSSKVLKGASKRKPCIVRTFTHLNKMDDEETRNSCDVDVNCDNSSNTELRYAHSPRETSSTSNDGLKSPTLEKIDTERMLNIIGVSMNYKASEDANSDLEGFSSYQDIISQQLFVEIEAITKDTATSLLNNKIVCDHINTTDTDKEVGGKLMNITEEESSIVSGLPLHPKVKNLVEMRSDNQKVECSEMEVNQNTLITNLPEEVSDDGQRTVDPIVEESTTLTSKLRRKRFSLKTIAEEKLSEIENYKSCSETEKTPEEQHSDLSVNNEEMCSNKTKSICVNDLTDGIQSIKECSVKINEDTAKPLSKLRRRKSTPGFPEEQQNEHSVDQELDITVKSQKRSELPTTSVSTNEFQDQTEVNKNMQMTTAITEDGEDLIRNLPKLRRKRRLTQETEEPKVTTESQEHDKGVESSSNTEQEKVYPNVVNDSENLPNFSQNAGNEFIKMDESETKDYDSSTCRISVRTLDELMECPKKDTLEQVPNMICIDAEEIVVKAAKPTKKKRKLHTDSKDKSNNKSMNIQQAVSYDQEVTFSSKAARYMDRKKLLCIPCQTHFTNFPKLIKHMAAHFDWYRFQCSKCSFISFSRSDCSMHALENHNIASSDIPSVVLPIPDWKIDLMSGDFHELTTVDVCGEGYEDMIIECKEEPVLVDHNELSRESGVIYIDNLFEDSQTVEMEVEDISINTNIKNESIDIVDEEKDSYKIDLSLEIYSTKIFEGISKLDGNDITERVSLLNPKINVKIESDIESESEYYVPCEKKTIEKSLTEIKQEKPDELIEDFNVKYNNNDDNVNIKSNSPIKKILPIRNRKKSVKTLQNDFVYDFNKFLKLNDCSVNKINSVQKQKKPPSSPTKASTSSTSKTVKISQKRK